MEPQKIEQTGSKRRKPPMADYDNAAQIRVGHAPFVLERLLHGRQNVRLEIGVRRQIEPIADNDRVDRCSRSTPYQWY